MTREDSLSAIETRLVLEAIHARYGYDLRQYVSDSMQRRMRAALTRSGLSDLSALSFRLLRDPELFALVLDQLTVQVTEMFRDPPFYRVFRERVAPLLRTYPHLKLWHAGCSSGEEVYATAIVLVEEGLYDRAQIYATDLSETALERAREGVYPEREVSRFADNYASAGGKQQFSDYYSTAYGRIRMRDSLRRNLVFFQHNLVSDYALGEMQVIFCRNVLFYFQPDLRRRVLKMFASGLCRGGFLCLGQSEAMPEVAPGTFASFASHERIFQRRGEG